MNIGFINLGNLTADPPSPTNGTMWYNSTLGKLRGRENGVSKDVVSTIQEAQTFIPTADSSAISNGDIVEGVFLLTGNLFLTNYDSALDQGGLFMVGPTSSTFVGFPQAVLINYGTYQNKLFKFFDVNNGGYVDVGGGGGSLNTVSGLANLDFGLENGDTIITIADTNITNANIKGATFLPQETANTSIDDFQLNAVSFQLGKIIDNTSFEILGTAANNAGGIYQIKYILTY